MSECIIEKDYKIARAVECKSQAPTETSHSSQVPRSYRVPDSQILFLYNIECSSDPTAYHIEEVVLIPMKPEHIAFNVPGVIWVLALNRTKYIVPEKHCRCCVWNRYRELVKCLHKASEDRYAYRVVLIALIEFIRSDMELMFSYFDGASYSL